MTPRRPSTSRIQACHVPFRALQIGSGAANKGFPGDIAEILVYTRALADAERQRLERALTAKYFR